LDPPSMAARCYNPAIWAAKSSGLRGLSGRSPAPALTLARGILQSAGAPVSG
jgi:hypothetical protein